MNLKKIKRGKIASRPSLFDTMRMMQPGDRRKFSTSDFKTSSVRTTASVLKKSGMEFTVTEAGMDSEYVIHRLK